MRKRQRSQAGNAALEFALLGLPVVFILISVINICMVMTTMHTMQEAVEQGGRYVASKGSGCTSGTNACGATVGTISKQIATYAAGVSASQMNLTLTTDSGTATPCNPVNTCYNSSTAWPPSTSSDNSAGKDVIISADYTVTSPIAIFWTGAGSNRFGQMTLHAYSRQRLMF